MTTKKSKAIQHFEKLLGYIPTFGDMVEAHRVSDEISQSALAKKLKISRAHLCDIEKGRRTVSLERAVQIAKVLGYSEKVFVMYALEDQIRKAGLKFKVRIEAA